MTMNTKTCKVCGRELPLTDFRLGRWGARLHTCNECVNEKREKREKTITTSQIPITKSQLSPADLVAIRYLMPYLNSALLERTKKKNNSLADLSENLTLANCLGRLEKLIDRPIPIIHDYR